MDGFESKFVGKLDRGPMSKDKILVVIWPPNLPETSGSFSFHEGTRDDKEEKF